MYVCMYVCVYIYIYIYIYIYKVYMCDNLQMGHFFIFAFTCIELMTFYISYFKF